MYFNTESRKRKWETVFCTNMPDIIKSNDLKELARKKIKLMITRNEYGKKQRQKAKEKAKQAKNTQCNRSSLQATTSAPSNNGTEQLELAGAGNAITDNGVPITNSASNSGVPITNSASNSGESSEGAFIMEESDNYPDNDENVKKT